MLDRLKLATSLERIAPQLFPNLQDTTALAAELWQTLGADVAFASRAAAAQSSFLVPAWRGNLADRVAVQELVNSPYTVVAVDGSQIYPDRHLAGAGCFLINTGGVVIRYGDGNASSRADFFSTPKVWLTEEVRQLDDQFGAAQELVDLLREQAELETAVSKAEEVIVAQGQRPVVFIDGTMIFWILESKAPEVKSYFLTRYLASLEQLYKLRVPSVALISLPKSRELVSLLKLGLCRFMVANCIPCHSTYTTFPCKAVEQLIDAHVARTFLRRHERTTVFVNTSQISSEYPVHLRTHFCYLDVGQEIVRLELPAWVVDDQAAFDHVCQVVLDQSIKGGGYPVCLAEAHEQAVVKGPDREFFYHLIHKIGYDQNRQVTASQKSIKKRGIGV